MRQQSVAGPSMALSPSTTSSQRSSGIPRRPQSPSRVSILVDPSAGTAPAPSMSSAATVPGSPFPRRPKARRPPRSPARRSSAADHRGTKRRRSPWKHEQRPTAVRAAPWAGRGSTQCVRARCDVRHREVDPGLAIVHPAAHFGAAAPGDGQPRTHSTRPSTTGIRGRSSRLGGFTDPEMNPVARMDRGVVGRYQGRGGAVDGETQIEGMVEGSACGRRRPRGRLDARRRRPPRRPHRAHRP